MENFIVLAAVVFVLGFAIGYIIRKKKSGVKCIGCPDGATCPHKGNCGDK